MFNFLSNSGVKKISAKEAKNRLESDNTIVVLDVREKTEYLGSHIPNSINLPLGNISAVEKVVPDKDTTAFVYCLSGGRSASASGQMSKMGYKNVYNLGGISGWHYETVSGK
ncbi:rhodanese-like domain-containing protein [Acetobacterium bakii]|uniref:Sulfurtransferase n=1 Tax=Acetobacterium bakii TaxID=52689 RepID=A0A0L6U098_9FIRM|nr:rhodanese-like domain-containing protein [Acetobacterium bakii]KNZ41936.1 sulfurtransferase [Acetobacterium bakii]